jgi:hypothetical protein
MIKFDGIVYVRPVGRGITVVQPENLDGRDLSEIFKKDNAYYKVSMTVKEVSEDEALNNWEEPEEEKDPVSLLFQK